MTSSVVSPQSTPAPPARSRRQSWPLRFFAFTPLWILIIASVAAPTFSQPMTAIPPDIVGIPLGVAIAGLAMLWMLIGATVIWDARSRFAVAFILFTIPATVVVVFTPAVVLIMQNLG